MAIANYKSCLLAVKDMQASLKFYKDLFDQEVILDLGWNKTLSCGIVLQEHFDKIAFIDEEDITFKANNMELYFECEDFDAFLDLLQEHKEVEVACDVITYGWHQRSIHIYDPNGHLIDVSESMYKVACKQFDEGYSIKETSERISHPVNLVEKWHENYIKALNRI